MQMHNTEKQSLQLPTPPFPFREKEQKEFTLSDLNLLLWRITAYSKHPPIRSINTWKIRKITQLSRHLERQIRVVFL